MERQLSGKEVTNMSGIIYDASKVKVYDALKQLCDYAGEPDTWCADFWEGLMTDRDIYDEFVFYLEHHELREKLRFHGYTLIDLFVWQMDLSNLFRDTGRNTAECNKEDMVLRAFETMMKMKKDPETWKKKIDEGPGMDRVI